MIEYPITIARNCYNGPDEIRRMNAFEENRIAQKLEVYINQQLRSQTEPVKTYTYLSISAATGIEVELVRKFCFSIDAGNGGFTARKIDSAA